MAGGMVGLGKIVVLFLACSMNVTQSAVQKKVQCLCTPKDDFHQYYISPPMTDVVDEAKDHCTVAWTCNTTECAFYDYEILEKKDAMMFDTPVLKASFEAVVIESQVEPVLVTVECPQKGFVEKYLPCPCEKPSPSTPSIPTNQDYKGDSQGAPERPVGSPPDNQDGILWKTILPFGIFTALGCVVVVLVLKRCKKNPEPNGQDPQQQPQHQQHQQQEQQEAFLLVSVNNPDDSDVNIRHPTGIDVHIDVQ